MTPLTPHSGLTPGFGLVPGFDSSSPQVRLIGSLDHMGREGIVTLPYDYSSTSAQVQRLISEARAAGISLP